MTSKRGKGTVINTFSWPREELDKWDKIVSLAPNGTSSLIRKVLLKWLETQEAKIENPIGLDIYNYNNLNSKHWIDSLKEPELEEIKNDIDQIEDPKTLAELSKISGAISRKVNERSIVVYRMKSRYIELEREVASRN